jgi:hypothetical protein
MVGALGGEAFLQTADGTWGVREVPDGNGGTALELVRVRSNESGENAEVIHVIDIPRNGSGEELVSCLRPEGEGPRLLLVGRAPDGAADIALAAGAPARGAEGDPSVPLDAQIAFDREDRLYLAILREPPDAAPGWFPPDGVSVVALPFGGAPIEGGRLSSSIPAAGFREAASNATVSANGCGTLHGPAVPRALAPLEGCQGKLPPRSVLAKDPQARHHSDAVVYLTFRCGNDEVEHVFYERGGKCTMDDEGGSFLLEARRQPRPDIVRSVLLRVQALGAGVRIGGNDEVPIKERVSNSFRLDVQHARGEIAIDRLAAAAEPGAEAAVTVTDSMGWLDVRFDARSDDGLVVEGSIECFSVRRGPIDG